MPRGSRFGPLGKKLVIVGNAQHGALRLRVVELIRAGAGFLGAVSFRKDRLAISPAVAILADGPALTLNNA
jgi:hypothetical protein